MLYNFDFFMCEIGALSLSLSLFWQLCRLVIKQMAELEGERRCWHQIGPMLAERRVMDVLPVLRENREQLVSALKLLAETIESREAELSELQKKHHIAETVV